MQYIGQGVDYISGPYSCQFNAGDNQTSFNISIINDNMPEVNEMFTLTIDVSSLHSNVTVGVCNQSTVTIADDDGKCKVINVLIQNCCYAKYF